VGRLLFAAMLVAPATAWAQDEATPEETAAARALFSEGVEHLDAERWDDAADRFARALDLRWAAPIAFNLALARAGQGRLVEAAELHRNLTRRGGVEPHVVEAARSHLRELEPRLAELTIRVTGDVEDATVELDGKPVARAMLGVAIPADPGRHEVVVRLGETELGREETEVAEGESGTLELLDLEAPQVPRDPPDLTPDLPDPDPDPDVLPDPEPASGGLSAGGWVGVVVAIVAVVAAGVVVGVMAPFGGADPVQGDTSPIEL